MTYQSNATLIEAADKQLSSVRPPGNSITPGNVRDVAIMLEFMNQKNDSEAGSELALTRMQSHELEVLHDAPQASWPSKQYSNHRRP
jgi:hypothetical protein